MLNLKPRVVENERKAIFIRIRKANYFVKVGKGKFLMLTQAAEGYFWYVVYIINGIFLGAPSFPFDLPSCSAFPFKKVNFHKLKSD